MKYKNLFSKKLLNVFLAIVLCLLMCFMDLASIGINTTPVANAGEVKASSVSMADVTFVVPEAIYLTPNALASVGSYQGDFVLYVNNNANGSTVANRNDQTGKIYWRYSNASDATLSYRFINEDFASLIGGSVTLSRTDCGTSRDIDITAGKSPTLSGGAGCYIEWIVSYTDSTDGKAKKAYAYTYVYNPYTLPIAAGGDAGTGTSGGANWAGQITWISGFHNLVSSTYTLNSDWDDRWSNYYTNLTNFSAFISPVNKGYSGTTSITTGAKKNGSVGAYKYTTSGYSEEYAVFANATGGYKLENSWSNSNPSGVGSGSSGTYTSNIANYWCGKYRANTENVQACVKAGSYGNIYIDTSRYNNLSQIPYLSIGMIVTDDENSSGTSGTWYIGDYSENTRSGDGYTTWHKDSGNRGTYYNDVNYKIAGQGTGPTDTSNYEKEGIRYAGAWPRTLLGSTGNQGATQRYWAKGFYGNADGGYYASTHCIVSIQATYYNKANLRTAVQNATKAFAKLGVNGISSGNLTSCYFDADTNYKWTSVQSAYKAAVIGLTKLTATTNPDTLATNLNNAISNLYTKVSYNGNGGNLSSTTATYHKIGNNANVNVTPTYTASRAGFNFKGWSTDSNAKTGSNTVSVGYNCTLYAIWEPITATFNVNHDSIRSNLFNGSALSTTSAAGLTFSYDNTTGIITINGTQTGDTGTIMYAPFVATSGKTYHITVDVISGAKTAGGGRMVLDAIKSNGSNLTTRKNVDFSAATANDWSFSATDASECMGIKFWIWSNGAANVFNNLKIRIKIEEGSVGSEYTPNGKFLNTSTYGTMPVPTRVGYVFHSWHSNSSLNNEVKSTTAAPSSSTTLYAKWTANTYTVNYNGNITDGSLGGYTSSSSHTYDTAGNVNVSAFTRKYTVSYNYNGSQQSPSQDVSSGKVIEWYKEASLTNKVCNAGGSVKNLTSAVNGSVTLYAKWQLGTVKLAVPEARPGYIFEGWYDNAGCTGTKIGDGNATYTPEKNITLYAKWKPITYYLVFNGNGATSGTMNQQLTLTYDKGEILPANQFSRSHSVTFNYNNSQTQTSQNVAAQFLGWSTDKDDTVAMYIDEGLADNMASTQDAIGTLFAIWNCGNVILPTPTDKQDCDFAGWYSDSGLTQFVGNAGDSFVVTKNCNLYAKWVTKSFDITFQTEDGVLETVKCELNSTPSCNVTPTKTYTSLVHYEFAGWSPAITAATEDATYTAVFEPVDHKITSTNVLVDSTCTTFGTSRYTCSCGYSWSAQDIQLKPHNFTAQVQAEKYFKSSATCTVPLTYYYCCSVCGEKDTETFTIGDVLPHTIVVDAAVPATCIATGLSQGTHCSVCKAVITAQEVVEKAEHDYKDFSTTPATCANPGKQILICSVCSKVEEKTIEPGAHEFNTEYTVDVAATCLTSGSKSIHCKKCNTVKEGTVEEIPATNHKPMVVKGFAATCLAEGYKDGEICTVCGEVTKPQEKIDKLKHTEVDDEAVAATCTTKGLTAGKHCSVCGTIIKFQTVVPLAKHTPVTLKAIPAGCLTDGLTEGEKCSVCNKILVAQETVPATGHTEEVIPAQAATCTEKGLTAGVKCSVCLTVLVLQKDTEMIPHDLVDDAEIPATCTTDGKEAGKHCKNCKHTEGCGVISALGHNPVNVNAVEATCTTGGHTAGEYCPRCETYIITPQNTNALGHNVTKVEARQATCSVPGNIEYYVCQRDNCGKYFSDEAATNEITQADTETAAAHTPVPYAEVGATCQYSGYTGGTYCSECGNTLTERTVIPQTEHSWNNGEITTTPKCNELGVKTYTCIWCPQTKTEDVEMIAHTPGAETTENEIQATATEKGGYDTVVRCSVCLTELSRVHYDIPEGHFKKAQAKENEVKADCENDGSYDLVIRWYDTNEIFASEHIVEQKLGHNLQDVAAQEQTCTQDGWDAYKYCTRCKYTTKVLKPALNHNMTHYAYVAPTCKTEGKLEYWYCSNCKVFFTKEDTTESVAKEADLVLAKNPENHAVELVHTEAKEAVCNASGNIEYWSCSACQKNFSDEAGTVAVNNVITTNADNHDLTYYEGKKPTCTKDGVFTDGYTAYSVCNRCEKVFGKEVVKSKGHNYTVLKEYKPTTCGEEYKQFVRCLDCGYETTLVTIQEHDYSNEITGKAPTCLEDGWESYKMCKNCGDYRKTVISKSDAYHQLSDWTVVTPATCTQSGKQVQTCVICGKTVNTKTISATGHTDADKDNKCDTCGSDMPQNSGNWFSRFIQWIKSIFAQIANMFK